MTIRWVGQGEINHFFVPDGHEQVAFICDVNDYIVVSCMASELAVDPTSNIEWVQLPNGGVVLIVKLPIQCPLISKPIKVMDFLAEELDAEG